MSDRRFEVGDEVVALEPLRHIQPGENGKLVRERPTLLIDATREQIEDYLASQGVWAQTWTSSPPAGVMTIGDMPKWFYAEDGCSTG